MNKGRFKLFFFSMLGIVIFGGMLVIGLRDYCVELPQTQCNSLWGISIVPMVGGMLLIETIWASRKKNRNQQQDKKHVSLVEPRTWSVVWGSSIIRIVLSTILLGLPVIFRGVYVVTLLGGFLGMALMALRRAITGNLPPHLDETNNTS